MIVKLEGHNVCIAKQGPNTEPPQTMGGTINNESTTIVRNTGQERRAAEATTWGDGGGAKCIVLAPILRHRFCCC